MLGWVGVDPINFIGDPTNAFIAVVMWDIWQWTPFVTLVLLAGLSTVPPEIEKAAKLETKSNWTVLRHVQLPFLIPSLVAVLILRTSDTLKLFDMPFTMTRGGPGSATEFIAVLIERVGNRQLDIGMAAAQSIIMLVITIVLARLYIRLLYREVRWHGRPCSTPVTLRRRPPAAFDRAFLRVPLLLDGHHQPEDPDRRSGIAAGLVVHTDSGELLGGAIRRQGRPGADQLDHRGGLHHCSGRGPGHTGRLCSGAVRVSWKDRPVVLVHHNRFVSPVVLAFPVFLISRELGLRDTHLALILMYLTFTLPIVIWICTDQFRSIPRDLDEAAMLEGASQWRIFRSICLPLAMPGVAVSSILSFIFSWNELLFAYILAPKAAKTAPAIAVTFKEGYDVPYGKIMVTSTLIVVPVLIFALLASKHLARGLTMGAVK